MWGAGWTGCLVLCYSDNAPIFAQVNRLHANDPPAAHMLRCLALFQALYDFWLQAIHIPGSANTGADCLSHNQSSAFLQSHPSSSAMLSHVPPPLIHIISSQLPQGILHLWRALRQFLECRIAPLTRKAYSSGWRRYQSFISSYSLTLLPISPEKVALFVAYLGQQGLAVTIEVYLAGLCYFNLLANSAEVSPSFHSPYLKLLLHGIQQATVSRKPSLVHLPITLGILAKIKSSLVVNPSGYDSILMWAAACTGFFGFLRTSEFLTPDNGPCNPWVHLVLAGVLGATHRSTWAQLYSLEPQMLKSAGLP